MVLGDHRLMLSASGRREVLEIAPGGDRVGLEALGRARVNKVYQGAVT